MSGIGTYPGTNLVKRICYGCDVLIHSLGDVWSDTDEAEVVCTNCKEKAEREYPGETHHINGTELLSLDMHLHGYRSDVSAWWCYDCDTVTDYCTVTNPS